MINILFAFLLQSTPVQDCTRMWVVRFLYQEPIFEGPDAARGWAWRSLETAPVNDWTTALERRKQIESEGYSAYANPACSENSPENCTEVHLTASNVKYASIKEVCCVVNPPGPRYYDCRWVDSLPPPAP